MYSGLDLGVPSVVLICIFSHATHLGHGIIRLAVGLCFYRLATENLAARNYCIMWIIK